MKLTVDIPDPLYHRLEALAASKDRSVANILLDALRDKLQKSELAKADSGWRAVFGAARAEDIAKVQRIIDDEFSSSR